MSRLAHTAHLARRFAGSLSRRPPDPTDEVWVASMLLPGELALWQRMGDVDRRHSIEVARRFLEAAPAAPREAVAGALLHDVGKVESGLGTLMRVVATVVGARGSRFRRYHDHERLGARLAVEAGSEPPTVELLHGEGRWAVTLRAADHV